MCDLSSSERFKLIDVIPYQFPIEIDEFRGLFYNKYGAILLSLSH